MSAPTPPPFRDNREAFETSIASTLECVCYELGALVDVLTVWALRGSEVMREQSAVEAAVVRLCLRSEKRSAEGPETEKGGAQ